VSGFRPGDRWRDGRQPPGTWVGVDVPDLGTFLRGPDGDLWLPQDVMAMYGPLRAVQAAHERITA
jgi:hypothetical protein